MLIEPKEQLRLLMKAGWTCTWCRRGGWTWTRIQDDGVVEVVAQCSKRFERGEWEATEEERLRAALKVMKGKRPGELGKSLLEEVANG